VQADRAVLQLWERENIPQQILGELNTARADERDLRHEMASFYFAYCQDASDGIRFWVEFCRWS